MKYMRKLFLMTLPLILFGCSLHQPPIENHKYVDLLIGPYSIKLPISKLENISIIGSANRGLALVFNRNDKDSQQTISLSVLHKSQLGYAVDVRMFPRLLLKLEEPTAVLNLSDEAIRDLDNMWKDIVEGRRTRVTDISGGHAYLVIDDENRQIIAYLTADHYSHEINFISTQGVSEERFQALILDNVYLNRLPTDK